MGDVVLVDLEISTAIPEGYVGLIFARSSLAKTGVRLANGVGVIDSGYRGNIKIPLIYDGLSSMNFEYELHKGDRVAQMVILPAALTTFEEVSDELPPSSDGREEGGFGSTGS